MRAGTEEDEGRDHGPGWSKQATAGEREQRTTRDWREETKQQQVEHARVQCGSWWCSVGCWQVHSEDSAVTGDTAR